MAENLELFDKDNIENWIFDLDNTIYPANSSLFPRVADASADRIYFIVMVSSEGIEYQMNKASLLENVNDAPSFSNSLADRPWARSKFSFNLPGPEKLSLLIVIETSVWFPATISGFDLWEILTFPMLMNDSKNMPKIFIERNIDFSII